MNSPDRSPSLAIALLEYGEHSHSETIRQSGQTALPRQVRRAIEFMTDNIGAPLDIVSIATEATVSPRALQLTFRQFNQTTPMSFLRELRLNAVHNDLLGPDSGEPARERGSRSHSTVNRWVLACAPLIKKRLRQFRRSRCGSLRIDETYVKIRGKWRYLCRAIDKHGDPIDFLLAAKRDLDAAKRFFREILKDEPLLAPGKIGTDGANTFPGAIKTAVEDGHLHPDPVHYVTKHLLQGIESDHYRVKKNMPKIGGFHSFSTARRTIAGFEAMLWLKKGFGFTGDWTVNDQNDLLARLFGLQKVNKA